MEPKQKKARLTTSNIEISGSSVCCDPFEHLHDDVHELIFQHLTWNEVTETSLTSKEWYKNIGRSLTAMKKIRLKYHAKYSLHIKPSTTTAVLRSSRKYQSIDFDCLFSTNFRRRAKVLTNFADSVVELKIGSIAEEFSFDQVTFPKLKYLTIGGIKTNRLTLQSLFSAIGSTELTKLAYRWFYIDEVFSYLRTHRKLKELILDQNALDILSHSEASCLNNFRLTHLELDFISHHYVQNVAPNVQNFLESQIDLEKISIDSCNTDMLICILNLPKLHTLKLKGYGDLISADLLPYNETVETAVVDIKNFNEIGSFFRKLKKLKKLIIKTSELKKVDFEKLFESSRLEELQYVTHGHYHVVPEVTDVTAFYESLKLRGFNPNIRLIEIYDDIDFSEW